MAQMNLVQAINDALKGEMKRDDRVVVMGEDVGRVGGVFRVTQGLWDEFGDDRVIDTPLSEGAGPSVSCEVQVPASTARCSRVARTREANESVSFERSQRFSSSA